MSSLNLRHDFTAFEKSVRGQPLVYLDTAATALKPKVMVDAITEFNKYQASNVHRGAHFLSSKATELFEYTRTQVAQYINARDEREIIFTSGTTDGINLVAQSYGRKFLSRGDEILLTQMEHHSNIVPWQLLAEEKGLVIKWAPVDDKGELDLKAFENLLSDKTKLIAVTHCSNVLGTVNPIKQIVDLAKKVKARVLVDAAQSATFMSINVQELGCDFLVFSAHKLYGPFGLGVLYMPYELMQSMPPYRGGGAMIASVSEQKTLFLDGPQRFEAGTPNISAVVGFSSSLNYVKTVGLNKIRAHESELLKATETRLKDLSRVREIGTSATRSNLLSFVVEDLNSGDIGQILDQQGVAVRVGHHCAQPLMNRFGITGTVRVSFGVYNSLEDVDIFARGLKKSMEMLR